MTKSPYIQELKATCLAEAIEDAVEREARYNGYPATLTLSDIERLMHVKVSVAEADTSKNVESLYSLLVGIFKDRRGRIVRACRKAISKVVDDMLTLGDDSLRPPKKSRSGGFTGPPIPRSNAPVYGFQRAIVTVTEKMTTTDSDVLCVDSCDSFPTERRPPARKQKTVVRMVDRGFQQEIEDSCGDEQTYNLYYVQIVKEDIAEYKKGSFYNDCENHEIEFDFPEHPSYLPYFAYVCDECNVRVPNSRRGRIQLSSQPDLVTSAQTHNILKIECDRHGNATEVIGTCIQFDAFVACQVC